jgi:hypothetical protein
LHQGDQRGDDDSGAPAHDRGNLVAERFAAAGWHQHQRVAACEHMVDDFRLRATKGVVPENLAQHLERFAHLHSVSPGEP